MIPIQSEGHSRPPMTPDQLESLGRPGSSDVGLDFGNRAEQPVDTYEYPEQRFNRQWQIEIQGNQQLLQDLNRALGGGEDTSYAKGMIACACMGIDRSPKRAADALERAIQSLQGLQGSQARELLCRFPLNVTAQLTLDTFIQIPTEPIPIGNHPFLDGRSDPLQDLRVS